MQGQLRRAARHHPQCRRAARCVSAQQDARRNGGRVRAQDPRLGAAGRCDARRTAGFLRDVFVAGGAGGQCRPERLLVREPFHGCVRRAAQCAHARRTAARQGAQPELVDLGRRRHASRRADRAVLRAQSRYPRAAARCRHPGVHAGPAERSAASCGAAGCEGQGRAYVGHRRGGGAGQGRRNGLRRRDCAGGWRGWRSGDRGPGRAVADRHGLPQDRCRRRRSGYDPAGPGLRFDRAHVVQQHGQRQVRPGHHACPVLRISQHPRDRQTSRPGSPREHAARACAGGHTVAGRQRRIDRHGPGSPGSAGIRIEEPPHGAGRAGACRSGSLLAGAPLHRAADRHRRDERRDAAGGQPGRILGQAEQGREQHGHAHSAGSLGLGSVLRQSDGGEEQDAVEVGRLHARGRQVRSAVLGHLATRSGNDGSAAEDFPGERLGRDRGFRPPCLRSGGHPDRSVRRRGDPRLHRPDGDEPGGTRRLFRLGHVARHSGQPRVVPAQSARAQRAAGHCVFEFADRPASRDRVDPHRQLRHGDRRRRAGHAHPRGSHLLRRGGHAGRRRQVQDLRLARQRIRAR